jgi:hypothetical protein
MRLSALVLVVSTLATPAWAETRRVAVIVGHNSGASDRPPLRFAEEDASRLAAVLEEVGGFAHEDLFVLRGGGLAALRRALDEAAARVTRWRAARAQVVALFYFSGHSDGAILELGDEALSFSEVRRWLERTGAEVRIGVVDTCKSGALLAAKGGKLAPAFDIHLADTLSATGDVLITSSAASEVALESADIGASFFSHHLVSGLRGAADLSGDGLVTLGEAYQYAFGRTVSATADTLAGPQHPGYDFRLSGRGDIVLTEIRRPSAVLELPGDLDRVVIRRAADLDVVAEVAATTARRIALAPGRYRVRGWRRGAALAGEVVLGAGEDRSLATPELSPVGAVASSQKGGPRTAWRLFLGGGAERAVAVEGGRLTAVTVRLRGGGRLAPVAALELATGRHDDPHNPAEGSFRESHAQLLGGARLSATAGRGEIGVGALIGGGVASQHDGRPQWHWSPVATAAVTAGARLRLVGPLAAAVEVQAPLSIVRSDGGSRLEWLPAGWLGLESGW